MSSPENKKPTFAKNVLYILITCIFLTLLLHIALKYISVVIFKELHGSLFELSARFDVNDEMSVPQWFSQILFLGVGLSSFLAAYLNTKKSGRAFWAVIGVLGVLLSLDDVATLHEFFLQNLHNSFFLDTAPSFFVNAWLLILPVILVIGAALAWWAWKVLPIRTMILITAGGLVYVLGKILMDSLSNNVTDIFLDRGFIQGLEKAFQYIGITIVLYGIIDFLERNHGKAIGRAVRALK